jgi:hypothetical protein
MKEGRRFFQAADDRTEKEPANAEERIHCDSGASERSHPPAEGHIVRNQIIDVQSRSSRLKSATVRSAAKSTLA